MKIHLSLANNEWTATIDGVTYLLHLRFPAIQITTLVTTLHNLYPGCVVSVDRGISQNPFFPSASRCFKEPLWEDIQACLENPSLKTCSGCGGETWYDPSVSRYHCPQCQRLEIGTGGHFRLKWKRGTWKV